jgi:hypothetical protein
MRYRWPADTVFTQQVLTVEQQDFPGNSAEGKSILVARGVRF